MVDRQDAERVVRALVAARLLDDTRSIAAGDTVAIPVRQAPDLAEWADRLGARLVDAELEPREGRITPHAAILARLPPELRPLAPDRWEKVGDVVVLRLSDEQRTHAREIAAAFAHVLHAKCIVEDKSGVAGEFREMQGELLEGDDPVTTHVENGVKFRLDASRIMFSSGNVAERTRAAKIPAAGETVVDMFAGIGYFALPIAVHAGPAKVIALEKSPLAFRYLEEGIRLNGVARIVETWLGDNREFPHERIADRVIMGYFPDTARFLPKAIALLKPQGGVIHYHDTAHERTWKDEMTRAVLAAARACGRTVAIEEARVVKSHSPGVVHAVIAARIRG